MDALLQEALPWLVSSNLPHLSSFHVRVLEEIFFKDIRSKYNIIITPGHNVLYQLNPSLFTAINQSL